MTLYYLFKIRRRSGGKQTKQTCEEKKSQDQTFSKPLILFISELSLHFRTNWKLIIFKHFFGIHVGLSLEGWPKCKNKEYLIFFFLKIKPKNYQVANTLLPTLLLPPVQRTAFQFRVSQWMGWGNSYSESCCGPSTPMLSFCLLGGNLLSKEWAFLDQQG